MSISENVYSPGQGPITCLSHRVFIDDATCFCIDNIKDEVTARETFDQIDDNFILGYENLVSTLEVVATMKSNLFKALRMDKQLAKAGAVLK